MYTIAGQMFRKISTFLAYIKKIERMNTMNRAYYKNPNRWMINHVPIRQERHIDWIAVMGFIALVVFSTWFAMLLWSV